MKILTVLIITLFTLFAFGCGKGGTHKVLRYAFCGRPCNSGSSWTKVTADGGGNVGEHTSLTFSLDDKPSISYYDVENKDLKYATCTFDCATPAPVWTLATVDTEGDVGKFTSILLDKSGNPHISYYDQTLGDLKYASAVNGVWSTLAVDTQGNVGQYTALALKSDNPRIAYYDRSNGKIRFALCDTNCGVLTNWTLTDVDSVGTIPENVERAVSLALDKDGNPWMAYLDVAGGSNLKYAVCKLTCTTITADSSQNEVGADPSIVMDSNNRPLISYFDATVGQLKVIICTGQCDTAAPVLTKPGVVDGQGTVGAFSSMVLGDATALLIGYYDLSFDAVKHASCNSSCENSANWTTMRVEGPGAGVFTSLALNSKKSPALSYQGEE